MKSASTTLTSALPDEPPYRVTGKLNWAPEEHAASVIDVRNEGRRNSV